MLQLLELLVLNFVVEVELERLFVNQLLLCVLVLLGWNLLLLEWVHEVEPVFGLVCVEIRALVDWTTKLLGHLALRVAN